MSFINSCLTSIFFVSAFIFVSIISSDAQRLPPEYFFLEVVDSENKPIPHAKVFDGSNYLTDEKGTVKISSGDGGNRYQDRLNSLKVSKLGYYTFEGLGLFRQSFPDKTRGKPRVELLKIPQNDLERKVIRNEQTKREFFFAVRNRDSATVRKLLKAGIDINISSSDLRGVPGPKNIPAILLAAAQADIETIKEFLSAGFNLRRKNSIADSILSYYLSADPFYAIYDDNNEEKVKRLVAYEKGVDVLIKAGANTKSISVKGSEEGKAPLTIAYEKGYTNIIKKLLGAGVSVDHRNKNGSTALMEILRSSDLDNPVKFEMLKSLLKLGADPNIYTNTTRNNRSDSESCETPLMIAVVRRRSEAIIKLLLSYKANLKFICKNSGQNAITIAEDSMTLGLLLEDEANFRFGVQHAIDSGNRYFFYKLNELGFLDKKERKQFALETAMRKLSNLKKLSKGNSKETNDESSIKDEAFYQHSLRELEFLIKTLNDIGTKH